MKEIEYQVRRNTPEYSEYLSARFNENQRFTISFPWKGHRWSYRYTDFDDEGDFDVIYRKEPVEHIQVPISVISAADIVSSYFETLGIKTWELGNCRNRF